LYIALTLNLLGKNHRSKTPKMRSHIVMFRNLDKPVLFNSVLNFEIESTFWSGGLNKNVDIKFSTHDAFLE
jgi:hypothetical protein